MKADLHLHSTASDGRLSPEDLVAEAARRGLSVIALTDHDSVEGIAAAMEAAAAYPELTFIPGVELSTDIPQEEVHVLGYFMDWQDEGLNQTLRGLRDSRYHRGERMVAKLADLGINIDWDRVLEIAAGASVGRPHVARALLEAGYISSFPEAFAKYIGRNGPAYVEREKLTPEQAVHLVTQVNGLAFLSHPATNSNLELLLVTLVEAGLAGIEVYYNNYDQATTQRLAALARKYHLMMSGGSDYHGWAATDTGIGEVPIPSKCITRFLDLARDRYLRETLLRPRAP